MPHTIIGTAGHIDHGKTALVQALTGVNTDRLKEEKERGLTIDLGFAHWGDWATIIDVPGHEKFIRNMVAGVSTIDLVLLVVAADDGVMPQTREHLDILRILQVQNGLVVLTKTDLVQDDWLELVKEDVKKLTKGTFLENSEIFAVSSVSKVGIPALAEKIKQLANEIGHKADTGIFWMPVDRSFSIKGFGTVLTGSVLSGSIRTGAAIEILPQKILTKIRGLQSHGGNVDRVAAGDRAAINLQSVEKEAVTRGCVVSAPDCFSASRRFHAKLDLLQSAPRAIRQRARVRLHFGTNEVMARVTVFAQSKIDPGKSGYVQFHLEQPAAARRHDAFVVRQYSPTITVGGGIILNADASKRKMSDKSIVKELQKLEQNDPAEVLESLLLLAKFKAATIEQLVSELATNHETVENLLAALEKNGRLFCLKTPGKKNVIHRSSFDELCRLTEQAFSDFHDRNKTRPGMRKAELKNQISIDVDQQLMDAVLQNLLQAKKLKDMDGILSLAGHQISLPADLEALKDKLAALIYERAFATPSESEMAELLNARIADVKEVIGVLLSLSEIVRIDEGIYLHVKQIARAKGLLISFLERHGEITISQFKDLLNGASRKYSLPLINYFDGQGLTRREGDVRVLN